MTDTLHAPALTEEARAARPMIIADDAHVTYRVYASGKKVGARDKLLSLNAIRGGRDLHSVLALRGVTFTALEGETIGVVGHNGSGKSTLFRAMSGLIPTSEGAIWARDRPVLLGVNAALVPELSGENNIKLGLLAMGFTPEEAASSVDEIADFAELNEFISHPMKTYSSGMGARLRFAIASARAHSILLIDEALAVGDRRFRVKSEQRIRELQDSAGLVMIVSHSVSSLKDTCERVLWIHKGELRADGPADAVIDDYVRWTKQPNSTAVGAAAPAKPSSAPPKAQTLPSVGVRTADTGLTALEELLAATSAKAGASEAIESRDMTAGPLKVSDAGSPENPRTSYRRSRYRRTLQERQRRRALAAVITAGAVVLATGAGAAIALLARTADSPDAITPRALAAAPTIGAFSASAPTAACAAPTGTADITLSWKSDDAVWVALAQGAAKVDAIDHPLVSGLPESTDAYTVAFPCAETSVVYTITVAGGEGSRVSSTVAVARVLPPEPTTAPEDESDVESGEYTDPGTNSDESGGSTVTDPGTGGGTTDPGTGGGTTDPGTGGGTTDPGTGGGTDPGTGGGTDPGTGGGTDPGTGGGTDPGTGGGETGAPVDPNPPAEEVPAG